MVEYIPVGDLSLCGLLARLQLTERCKRIVRPNDEETSLISDEAVVKKNIAETLELLVKEGLNEKERTDAIGFLDAQIQSVEPGTKKADAKLAKLQELLINVRNASDAEEPAHVSKAKEEVLKAQKDFECIHKEYERWEKGKKMLDVSELTKLKRSHKVSEDRLKVAKEHLSEQQSRRASAAAPIPECLCMRDPGHPRPKASAPSAVRGGGPAVRKTQPYGPATGVVGRKVKVIGGQVQDEEPHIWPTHAPVAVIAPAFVRKCVQKPVEEALEPTLLFSCTRIAVAELLGVGIEKFEDLAESSDFKRILSAEQWETVRERSVAIEKERNDKAREAERIRKANALAKITGDSAKAFVPTARAAGAAVAKAPPSVSKISKAKAKAKASNSKQSDLGKLGHSNPFGSLEDDSDENGWTTVRR